MRKTVKLLCCILACTLFFSVLPIITTAATQAGYVWPVDNGQMSQGFYAEGNSSGHATHLGLDITKGYGAEIKAINNGTVMCASKASTDANAICYGCNRKGAGYHVTIQHADGLISYYAHLSDVYVSSGDKVTAGQVIGAMGSTGNSTGAHLHFIIYNGVIDDAHAVNPLTVITPFSSIYTYDVTETSATLEAYFGASAPNINDAGFYIGTSPDNMTKITEPVYSNGINPDGSLIATLFYNTSKWYQQLTPGTTYYYKFWMTAYDAYYESDVYTFKTVGNSPITPTPVIQVSAPPTPTLPPTPTATSTSSAVTPTPIIVPENAPQIKVESVEARADEYVEVKVLMNNNPGLWGADLRVSYDKAKLTLTEIKNGEIFDDTELTAGVLEKVPYILSYALNDIENNVYTNGTLATLVFKINANAVEGDKYDITLSYRPGDICDVDFNDIDFALISGNVTVIDFIYGDVNDDTFVNKKDDLALRKYLANPSFEINQKAANVFYDSSINKKDLLMLKQHLANPEIILGK